MRGEQPGFADRRVGIEPVRRRRIEFRRRRILVISRGLLDVVDVFILVDVVDFFDVVIEFVVLDLVVELVVGRRIEFVVGRRRQLVVELQPFEQLQWIGIVAGRWWGRRGIAARTAGLEP